MRVRAEIKRKNFGAERQARRAVQGQQEAYNELIMKHFKYHQQKMLAVSSYFITKLAIPTWELNIAYFHNQQQLRDQVTAAETEVTDELDSTLLEEYHTQKLTRAQALQGQ